MVFTDGEDNKSTVSKDSLKEMLKKSAVDILPAASQAKVMAATELGVDEKDVSRLGLWAE